MVRIKARRRTGGGLLISPVRPVIGIGAAILIYDAVHSRSVVIDTFEIAPNIATLCKEIRSFLALS